MTARRSDGEATVLRRYRLPLASLSFGALALASLGLVSVPASQAAVTHSCGASIRSTIKTDIPNFTTSSTTFVNVPGGVVTVDIPAGRTRCVKVHFSASMSCSTTGSIDLCDFRAGEIGGSAFDPPLNGIDFADGQGDTFQTHSFEWVKELGAGSHKIRVQAGVGSAPTTLTIRAWTLEVEERE